MKDFNRFEKEIRQTYQLPHADPAFINRLEKECTNDQSINKSGISPFFHKAKGWVYATVTLLVLATLFFAIGPSKVLAQIQAVLGYIPGIGVVDTSESFYQLTEPVSSSREEVTVTIQSGFISADQIMISYTQNGLSEGESFTPFSEQPICGEPATLTFQDGSIFQSSWEQSSVLPDGSYEHSVHFYAELASNAAQAELSFPCLAGTALDEGLKDWHFNLAFEPAPEDLTVFPVTLNEQSDASETKSATIEVSPQPDVEDEATTMPAMIVDGDRQEEMTVLGMVEKEDSYWVTWVYPTPFDQDVQVNGFLYLSPFNPVLYDANGVELPQPDLELRNALWDYQADLLNQLSVEEQLKYIGSALTFAIPKSGIAFPVYAKLNVFERSFPEKKLYDEIQFDGTLIQNANAPVQINQKVQIGTVEFDLVSIEKSEYGGYTFNFDGAEDRVIECRIELIGHSTNFSGQESLNREDPFNFYQSLMFSTVPTGNLTVRIYQPSILVDMISLIDSWSPDN